MVDVAVIVNEPTPYRLHLLGRMARALAADGVRLHSVFTHRLHEAGEPWRMEIDPAIGPVFFPDVALSRGLQPRRAVRLFNRIADHLLEHRVRLIVLHGYADLTRLLLARWANQAGIPLLLRGDSNVHAIARTPVSRRLAKRLLLRWLLPQVSGLMPMGRCGELYFQHYLPRGVELPMFRCPYEAPIEPLQNVPASAVEALLDQHQLDPGRRRVLYLGRLVPHKRVDVLLDAFAAVAARRPAWDLVIAGDGPQRGELQQRVPADLQHRVKWLGFLQYADAAACLRACHVLAHPSAYEPWGVVIQEAVAAGLAVVTTDVVGAAAELVMPGVNGLIAPAGDTDAFAAALLTATGDHARLQAAAPSALARWQQQSDPVEGLRAALRHFHVIA
jgi:glycosyltransferase involved in cell wall biosynthesis